MNRGLSTVQNRLSRDEFRGSSLERGVIGVTKSSRSQCVSISPQEGLAGRCGRPWGVHHV